MQNSVLCHNAAYWHNTVRKRCCMKRNTKERKIQKQMSEDICFFLCFNASSIQWAAEANDFSGRLCRLTLDSFSHAHLHTNMCILNHRLELDFRVLTNFDHDRQWFNTHIPPSHETAAVTVECTREVNTTLYHVILPSHSYRLSLQWMSTEVYRSISLTGHSSVK